MKNLMNIEGRPAVISYDPDIGMLRGEFVELNGGADFYAKDIKGLKREGTISLRVFLEACKEDGVEPVKAYSGRFNVRIPPDLHARTTAAAHAAGQSLNQWIEDTLKSAAAAQ